MTGPQQPQRVVLRRYILYYKVRPFEPHSPNTRHDTPNVMFDVIQSLGYRPAEVRQRASRVAPGAAHVGVVWPPRRADGYTSTCTRVASRYMALRRVGR